MSLLWALLGFVLGCVASWVVAARQSDLRLAEAEERMAKDVARVRADALDADLAHNETKARLVTLQLERRSPEPPMTLPAVQAPAEAGAMPHPAAPAVVPVPSPASHPDVSATAPAASRTRPGDLADLKRIKGIGPALERRLKALGIETVRHLAELSPGDVDRLNAKLDFPGRIQRERWIEQARELLAS